MPIKVKTKQKSFFMNNFYLYSIMAILIASLSCMLVVGRTENYKNRNNTYSKGAVASEHTDCSRVGKNILIKGGSAVDAAIATSICIGVMNNFSSGIGGGGFMLIHEEERGGKKKRKERENSIFIDYREIAPELATKEFYGSNVDKTIKGSSAIAVPGQIRGYEMAHGKYGKLKWKELFEESIKICKEGFPMTEKQYQMILKVKEDMKKSPALLKTYFDKDGNEPKKIGEKIYRLDLAKTLEIISSENGIKEFYEVIRKMKLITFCHFLILFIIGFNSKSHCQLSK